MFIAYTVGVVIFTIIWFICFCLSTGDWMGSKERNEPAKEIAMAAREVLIVVACIILVPIWPLILPLGIIAGGFYFIRSLIRDTKGPQDA